MRATVVAIVALACASLAGAATSGGRIVFSATDDPFSDDVMLVRADGTELDLSNSPALDTAPVVSPDGTRVAFFSARGGRGAEWVVGVDGRGLRRVTPSLVTEPAQVAWAPDGAELAVLTGSALYRASRAGGMWSRLDRHDDPRQLVGWSPDGNALGYVTATDEVKVVSRSGRLVHAYVGGAARWSPAGALAVQRDSTSWRVFAPSGRLLARIAATDVAWSPQGRLASVTAKGVLQVRARAAARPLLIARPVRNGSDPVWAGATHVLIRGDGGYLSFDVAHRATFLPAAAYRIDPALARDGSAYGESPFGTLVHSTLAGSTRTVASVGFCQGKDADAFSALQSLPDGSAAVFAADCAAPHDIFSMQPGGSGVTRITQTATDEIDPSLSPDGTRIAFTRVDSAGCAGCNHIVWTSRLDGSDAQSVSLPVRPSSPILQDDRPSFSPDGSRVVFSRWDSSVSDQAHLAEAPARGGEATSLKPFGQNPAWGPARIAFDGPQGVETVAPDGSGPQAVAHTTKLDSGVPAWSADGRLALLEWEGRALTILLPATGKRIPLAGLHAPPFGSPGLAWSPDGSRFAFTAADRDGVADVWTIGADGTGLTRVTHELDATGAIAWR